MKASFVRRSCVIRYAASNSEIYHIASRWGEMLIATQYPEPEPVSVPVVEDALLMAGFAAGPFLVFRRLKKIFLFNFCSRFIYSVCVFMCACRVHARMCVHANRHAKVCPSTVQVQGFKFRWSDLAISTFPLPSEPSQQSRCEVFFFFFSLLMLPLWFRSALCFSIQNASIARIASLPVRIATADRLQGT